MRTRLSICRKKQRFATRELAVAGAGDLALFPYRCEKCWQFHLTSRRKGHRTAKPVPR